MRRQIQPPQHHLRATTFDRRQHLRACPDAIREQVDEYFPLQYAISAAQTEALDCLLRLGDDPNKDLEKVAYFVWEDEMIRTSRTPWKPIHIASLWGFENTRIPIAERLIAYGADVNAASPLDGYRPIHLVAMPNRVDMIRFYVANGVDVDSRTAKGKGFDFSPENRGPLSETHGCTPLIIACGEGHLEAVECLLDLDANVNARNSAGDTPLHIAARRFWPERPYDAIIDVLVSHGADKKARNDVGQLP